VRWQNTSFNFAKRWQFRPPFLSVYVCSVGRPTLAPNDLHVSDGRGTEAQNCKPITNLKEKTELSNYSKTSAYCLHAVIGWWSRPGSQNNTSHFSEISVRSPFGDV
jgi:hypothetical protein